MRARLLIILLLLLVQFGSAQYVEDSVNVGGSLVYRLAYNSRHKVVYGIGGNGSRFFAVACSSNQLVGSIPLTDGCAVAFDSADDKGYCSSILLGSLLVLDGRNHTPIATVVLPDATIPLWDPDSDRLYVSLSDRNRVAVVDCRNDSVLYRIPVGAWPLNMYLNRRHRRLYVVNYDDASVSVINLDSGRVAATVPVGGYPWKGCYSTGADKFYACGEGVAVIDGASDTLIAHIALPPFVYPVAAAAVESRGLVMVAARDELGGDPDTVYVINTANDSLVRAIPVARYPESLIWSSLTNRVYCGSYCSVEGPDTVTVMTDDGTRITHLVPVSEAPVVMLHVPEYRRIYVGHANSPWLYVLRDTVSGIAEESATPVPSVPHQPTLIRGVLHLRPSPFPLPVGEGQEVRGRSLLLDVSGCAVMPLSPGPNDVRHLAPGVYFVRRPSAAAKVIIE